MVGPVALLLVAGCGPIVEVASSTPSAFERCVEVEASIDGIDWYDDGQRVAVAGVDFRGRELAAIIDSATLKVDRVIEPGPAFTSALAAGIPGELYLATLPSTAVVRIASQKPPAEVLRLNADTISLIDATNDVIYAAIVGPNDDARVSRFELTTGDETVILRTRDQITGLWANPDTVIVSLAPYPERAGTATIVRIDNGISEVHELPAGRVVTSPSLRGDVILAVDVDSFRVVELGGDGQLVDLGIEADLARASKDVLAVVRRAPSPRSDTVCFTQLLP